MSPSSQIDILSLFGTQALLFSKVKNFWTKLRERYSALFQMHIANFFHRKIWYWYFVKFVITYDVSILYFRWRNCNCEIWLWNHFPWNLIMAQKTYSNRKKIYIYRKTKNQVRLDIEKLTTPPQILPVAIQLQISSWFRYDFKPVPGRMWWGFAHSWAS